MLDQLVASCSFWEVLKLSFVGSPDEAGIGACRHANAAQPKALGNRMVYIFIQMEPNRHGHPR